MKLKLNHHNTETPYAGLKVKHMHKPFCFFLQSKQRKVSLRKEKKNTFKLKNLSKVSAEEDEDYTELSSTGARLISTLTLAD